MRWIPALLLLVVAACGRPAEPLPEAEARTTRAPDDRRAWLAVYDEAGFADVSGLRRVEFERGRSWGMGDTEPTIEYERGWVLSTTPLVLLRDSLWTFEPEGVEVPEFMRDPAREAEPAEPRGPFTYREVDFAEELRAELEAIEAQADHDDPFGMDGRRGPLTTYWLVRARWAEMRGLLELSRRALVQVERWATIACRDEDCTPEQAIRGGFQLKLLWQATDGLGDFMPRPQVRELLTRAVAISPDSPAVPLVTELLDRVDRTIATDVDDPTWPTPDDPDRVERLIHLLREQNGQQLGQPGFCDPMAVFSPIRNPAAELAALGREVIPALIEHIDDDTVTRSIGYHRDFHFSHEVLSVGDVALDIIERIAGRSFFAPQAISSTMSKEGEAAAVQQRVREWWAGAEQLSERAQLLRDLAGAEEHQRARLARKLLNDYGIEVWSALTQAFAKTTDAKARADLLYAMDYGLSTGGPVGSEPIAEREIIEQFLVDALEDRAAIVRFAAARSLSERGRHDGTEILIRDLEHYWLEPRAWSFADNTYQHYFSVLLEDGSAAAVDAIDRALRRRGDAAIDALIRGGCWGSERCKLALDAAAKDRLLDTLAAHLDDPEDYTHGTFGGGPGRVRDKAAAAYLALIDRDVAAFASLPTSIERDREILDLLNRHRAQRGQPPVSWPHLAPLQGTPGRDHVQRVLLVRAVANEAVAREWLAGFADRDLDPEEISTSLVELALRHPDVPFTLGIHRFPADAGVMLTLNVGAPSPSPSRGYVQYGVVCGGSGCGGASFGSQRLLNLGSASELFADNLRETIDGRWNQAPTGIEEYFFRVEVSSAEPSAGLSCGCTIGEGLDSGWLFLIAGLVPLGLARVAFVRA